MPLLTPRAVYSPFEYPQAYTFWELQQQSHWLHTEISMGKDIEEWNHTLTDAEKNLIGHILKGFTQSEVFIQEYWSQMVAKWFKKPEIQMMAASFSSMESIHAVSYAYLNQSLGLEDFAAFLHEPSAKAKIDRLMSTKGKTKPEIARSLAIFSAFNEGVSLFSSFAILLNFSRFNKMKGLSQIIQFSIKDESLHCLPIETKVKIKDKGFIALRDVEVGDIAYGYEDGKVVETKVKDTTIGLHSGEIIKFDNKITHQTVTDGHYMFTRHGEYIKVKDFIKTKCLGDLVRKAVPLDNCDDYLISDAMLKLMVAVQVDGCYSKKRPNEIRIHLYKVRKVHQLEKIFSELGYTLTWKINETSDGRTKYTTSALSFPIEIRSFIREQMPTKCFPRWFTNLSARQKRIVVDEVKLWDGTKYDNGSQSNQYCSKVPDNSYILTEILTDLGLFPRMYTRNINNREYYYVLWSEYHTYGTYNAHLEGKGHGVKKQSYTVENVSDMEVGCLSTETKNFIIMTDHGTVELTGNSTAGCWLFNTLVQEYPEIWTDELKGEIYDAAKLTVELEDDFIDKAFSIGAVEGITAKDVKAFIRHRTNTKLQDIGLKIKYFNIDKDALKNMEYFDILSGGVGHGDFFAVRISDYSKGDTNWDLIDFGN